MGRISKDGIGRRGLWKENLRTKPSCLYLGGVLLVLELKIEVGVLRNGGKAQSGGGAATVISVPN